MRTVQSRITARENVVNMRIHLLKKGVRNFPHTLQRQPASRNCVAAFGWFGLRAVSGPRPYDGSAGGLGLLHTAGGVMVPIENVYEQIRTFAADAGARKVVLFGSRAKGVNRPKSDIDLAVAGCPDFNRLEQNLQDNLWSLLKVDVINLDEPISESLRAEIERSGKVLYEKV